MANIRIAAVPRLLPFMSMNSHRMGKFNFHQINTTKMLARHNEKVVIALRPNGLSHDRTFREIIAS
jgi:hypothetical protein